MRSSVRSDATIPAIVDFRRLPQLSESDADADNLFVDFDPGQRLALLTGKLDSETVMPETTGSRLDLTLLFKRDHKTGAEEWYHFAHFAKHDGSLDLVKKLDETIKAKVKRNKYNLAYQNRRDQITNGLKTSREHTGPSYPEMWSSIQPDRLYNSIGLDAGLSVILVDREADSETSPAKMRAFIGGYASNSGISWAPTLSWVPDSVCGGDTWVLGCTLHDRMQDDQEIPKDLKLLLKERAKEWLQTREQPLSELFKSNMPTVYRLKLGDWLWQETHHLREYLATQEPLTTANGQTSALADLAGLML